MIKVSNNKRQLKEEAAVIKRIRNYVEDKDAVPDIKTEGLMTIDQKSNYYFTMTRQFQSLQDILDSGKMNEELIFRIGHQLLRIFKGTH